jgi:hypothetical protein
MLLESLAVNQSVIFHIKYILSLDLQVPEGLFQRRNPCVYEKVVGVKQPTETVSARTDQRSD